MKVKTRAPTAGPSTTPCPPATTMTAMVTVLWKPNSSGERNVM